MSKLEKSGETKVWIISSILGFLVLIPTFIFYYVPLLIHAFTVPPAPTNPSAPDVDVIRAEIIKTIAQVKSVPNVPVLPLLDVVDLTYILALALLLLPALSYWADQRWRKAIDENIPGFLREISDAQKTGLPLPRAVLQASKHRHGPLTKELKKMAAKITWGIAFSRAMKDLTAAADTDLMKQTSLLILEAERSGGVIEDVFKAAHEHVKEILALRKEREGSLKPYTYIVYTAYLIFGLVMVIISVSFINLIACQGATATAETINQVPKLPLNVAGLQMLFYHLIIIEAVITGLIAGKMSTGNAKYGLKHSVLMLTIGYIFFKILVLLGISC